jgi:phosphoglycerol transferase MdoB-like AlkP superfamily enzyme
MNSASSYALAFLNRPDAVKSPDMVLIVVESWGLPLDAHLAQALNAPYDDPRIAHKYDVSYGSVPFGGSTVPGESRELCHSRMGFDLLVASSESLHGCLPALFHASNYENLAIHGYFGTMFQRKTWYPKIGFDRIWFRADLDKIGLTECDGAFPGTCDASVAGWIGRSLLSVDTGKPRFIYWVTLNSHLPVPAHPNLTEDGVCSAQPLLRDSVPMCSWFRLVRNVHQSVQQLALSPSASPTVFVVVGDHAPPFADPKLRQNFSRTDVPYVLLTPRIASR